MDAVFSPNPYLPRSFSERLFEGSDEPYCIAFVNSSSVMPNPSSMIAMYDSAESIKSISTFLASAAMELSIRSAIADSREYPI